MKSNFAFPSKPDKWRALLMKKIISLKNSKDLKLSIHNSTSRNNPVPFNYLYNVNCKRDLFKDIENDSNSLSKIKLPSIKGRQDNSKEAVDNSLPQNEPCLFFSQGVQTLSPVPEQKPQCVFNTPPRIKMKMIKFSFSGLSKRITPKIKRVVSKGIQTPQNRIYAFNRYINHNLSHSTKNITATITDTIQDIRKMFILNRHYD